MERAIRPPEDTTLPNMPVNNEVGLNLHQPAKGSGFEILKGVNLGVNLPSDMQGRLPNQESPSVWGKSTLLRREVTGYHELAEHVRNLGIDSVRLSVGWTHIMEPGYRKENPNQLEILRTKGLLKHLRDAGVKNITLTLHHFDEPESFNQNGGFLHEENLVAWDNYVRTCAENFAGLVDAVIPVNEPNIYVPNSHIFGIWPPHGRNPISGREIFRNLAQAHIRAAKIMKAANPNIQIGCAVAVPDVQPGRNFPNRVAKWISNKFREVSPFSFIDKVKDTLDFIGVQSYFPIYIGGKKVDDTSDMGWIMDLSGSYLKNSILEVSKRYTRNGAPIPVVVTENGAPLKDISKKIAFIKGSLRGIRDAIEGGANLKGYFIWNLLSNDEFGENPEISDFGLIHMDPITYETKVTKAAEFYKKAIRWIKSVPVTKKPLPFDKL